MLIVISPAKTLDFDTKPVTRKFTQPDFLDESQMLIDRLREFDPARISALMSVSDNLGELNHRRFMNWAPPFDLKNSKQALLAFRGDVYTGLDADSFSAADFTFAQKHLRILSGLYGLLKPLDLMQAYRLEMGTALDNVRGANLYSFWGERITDELNSVLSRQKKPLLINLASQEYFKAVHPKQLAAPVITPIFKERKGDTYKIVSFFAKKARGLMSAYIIKQRLQEAEAIKEFDSDGYRFNPQQSRATEWVFTRDSSSE
ncbi:MAG: hypothetical protein JWM78_3590 [Verrucomicrobiaceae bacterium]|nr:hypothetical protein [Verrucomicrobiaceae bacterium]